MTLPNGITVTGGTNSVLSFENGDLGVFSGPITLNANVTLGLRDWYNYANVRSGTVSGVISGAGELAINSGIGSGGTPTLSAANSFIGNVAVNNARGSRPSVPMISPPACGHPVPSATSRHLEKLSRSTPVEPPPWASARCLAVAGRARRRHPLLRRLASSSG